MQLTWQRSLSNCTCIAWIRTSCLRWLDLQLSFFICFVLNFYTHTLLCPLFPLYSPSSLLPLSLLLFFFLSSPSSPPPPRPVQEWAAQWMFSVSSPPTPQRPTTQCGRACAATWPPSTGSSHTHTTTRPSGPLPRSCSISRWSDWADSELGSEEKVLHVHIHVHVYICVHIHVHIHCI